MKCNHRHLFNFLVTSDSIIMIFSYYENYIFEYEKISVQYAKFNKIVLQFIILNVDVINKHTCFTFSNTSI